jgi:peptidoglycan/LPS O-acetylase OafA/YrhL
VDQIRSHTGLRGIAALLVVFYHFHFAQPHLAFEDWTAFFERGYLMVDLFFVLSGFIISYVYDVPGKPIMKFVPFLMKRLIRLYPLHLFCLFLYLFSKVALYGLFAASGRPVELFWDDADPLKFLAQLLLIQPWLNSEPGWNIPSWSIGTEIFAYCLFPLAARALRLWPRIAGLALLGASIGFYAWVATGTGSLDIVYGTAPLRCLAGFLLGMLVYQQRSLVAALPVAVLSAGQIAALAAILWCLAVPVNDVLLIPPFLVLVAFTWTDAGWLARQLSRPPFQFLGEISYSVYLTHFSVVLLLFPVTLSLGSRLGLDPLTARAIWFVVGTAAVIVFSFGTYRLVEVPARKWLSGKWAAWRADAAPRQGAAA